MTKYVMLFELYKMLADMLVLSMETLGFEVDVGNSLSDGVDDLRARPYACVFINLDQNCQDWHGGDGFVADARVADTA